MKHVYAMGLGLMMLGLMMLAAWVIASTPFWLFFSAVMAVGVYMFGRLLLALIFDID